MTIVRCLIAVACLWVCNGTHGQQIRPVRWIIEKESETGAGVAMVLGVRVIASIEPQWHVYAMSGEIGGATHLSFALPSDSPFTMAGPVKPAAAFPFESSVDGKSSLVNAYQGTAVFTMSLRRIHSGKQPSKLLVNVHYQACSDTMCTPPKTEQLSLDLSSEPSGSGY